MIYFFNNDALVDEPRHQTLQAFASYHELVKNRKSRISPGLISLHGDVLFIAPSELGLGLLFNT
jgi:hypothetical protein